MFGEQSSVDEFVATGSKKVTKVTCSDFKAGNALRSASRYHALDETAVFGCACRHEFPKRFINMRYGERLSYAVWMLQEMSQDVRGKPLELYVMYDIACTLKKHLQVVGMSHVLEEVHLAVPAFHAYGHNASCQLEMSPLRCQGFGLSDGEVLERLWSYLRRFGRMTKEMRPSHRVDVLTHALLHYGYKTKEKLPKLLYRRWKRANDTHTLAQDSYQQALSTCPVQVLEADVQLWAEEEKAFSSAEKSTNTSTHYTSGSVEWKMIYVQTLSLFHHLREEIATEVTLEQYSATDNGKELQRLERTLSEFEKEHQIPRRWEVNDPDYLQVKTALAREKQKQICLAMWSSVVRRQFLLGLKGKYADGQKVAKRLSTQIGKETKKVEQLLQQYNDCTVTYLPRPGSSIVTLRTVLNPQDPFWHTCPNIVSRANLIVPLPLKQELIHSHLLAMRSSEEMEMIRKEMSCTLQYLIQRILDLKHAVEELKEGNQSSITKGAIGILLKQNMQAELHLKLACPFFKGVIPIPLEAQCLLKDTNESPALDDSDSDDDNTSDDDCDS